VFFVSSGKTRASWGETLDAEGRIMALDTTSGVMAPPRERTTQRSTTFSSCRTFPGQFWAISSSIASSVMDRAFILVSQPFRAM
jgi:hypothetical protein